MKSLLLLILMRFASVFHFFSVDHSLWPFLFAIVRFRYACVCAIESQFAFVLHKFIFESIKNTIKTHFDEEFEPEILIADGADAINAFHESFASAKLDIMCFAHVIRNCYKRSFTSKNNKHLIIDDIRKMQLAPNQTTFKMMSGLFLEKWKRVEPDFVKYMKKEWLGVHSNWFEGSAYYTPSHNNGQESHNAVIKRKVT